jgi:hypothetical protein
MKRFTAMTFAGCALLSTLVGQAHALTVPFTETFESGAAGWTAGTNPSQLVPDGGADGGAYLSTTLSPSASAFGSVFVVFRCESATCSDGAFRGDWRNDITLSWQFRHDADVPLQAYARIAAPANNPGASAVLSTFVQPDTWTRVDLVITPDNPAFVSFSGQSFDAVFDDIGRLQIGISLPTDFSGENVRFDIDSVSLAPIPEPQTYALFAAGLALVGASVARKRR